MLSTLAAIAPLFDVEAASRAYLDTLQGAARAQSNAYFEGGYWLILWDAVVAAATYIVMLHFGWSASWRNWSGRIIRFRFVQAMLYSVPFIIVGTLLALPWTIYTGFIREKQYGLMNQSFPAWLSEQAIQLAVGVVTTSLVIAVLFAVIRRFPRHWWVGATAAMVAMLLLFAMVVPVFISPLFNTYTAMPASPLRSQILTMAHAQGIPTNNVYVFDASKQTKRISANVSGLGPTIRISLNDNLLHRSTPQGVKAVMGHEMGHYVLDHVQWMIAQFAVLIAALMFLLWWSVPRVIARFGGRWGVKGAGDLAAIPVYFLIVTLMMLVATPITNTLVRRHEIQADIFGLDAAREPDGFAETAMQLSEYRKIEPGPIEEAIFFDHPSGSNRVHRSMAWKAAHLAELPLAQRAMVRPLPPSASSMPANASTAPAAASNVQR